MTIPTQRVYRGDGAYAENLGHTIRIYAPRQRGDDEVYLGPDEWQTLLQFVRDCWGQKFAEE